MIFVWLKLVRTILSSTWFYFNQISLILFYSSAIYSSSISSVGKSYLIKSFAFNSYSFNSYSFNSYSFNSYFITFKDVYSNDVYFKDFKVLSEFLYIYYLEFCFYGNAMLFMFVILWRIDKCLWEDIILDDDLGFGSSFLWFFTDLVDFIWDYSI